MPLHLRRGSNILPDSNIRRELPIPRRHNIPQGRNIRRQRGNLRLGRRWRRSSSTIWWRRLRLYPDPLLGEILAASTYPMEIAEAEQWVRDHPNWKGIKLMDEAKKQNWDPSVQGLVAFPDVLARLTQNISWTTQLGNAFLADQADVMQAVQRMRAQAQAKGTLHSTPQETVTTQNQNGQIAISIEPADPNVWYVPNYNPAYVWGPPVWGAYPPLLYPGIDVGFGWFPGIDIGLYFGGWGGWGWGGWGWAPNWYGGGYLHRSILSFIVSVLEIFDGTGAWEFRVGA